MIGTILHRFGIYHSAAPPDAVWAVYTDVDLWPTWSTDIARASLDGGDYVAGATGTMKFRQLPETTWRVLSTNSPWDFRSEVDVRLAKVKVARLVFDHTLEPHVGGTIIREDIRFRGPLGWLIGLLYSKTWKRQWPEAMGAMCELAFERAYPRGP